MRYPNFCGGTYQSWSPNAAAERSINLYPEMVETPSGKSRVGLYGTPGLSVFCTLGTSPVRGLWAGEGRLFAVAGSHYYEISSGGVATDRGDVGDDGSHTPVDIWPNGGQVMIVSAGKVWIDTGTDLVQAIYTDGAGAVDTTAALTGTCDTATAGRTVTWTGGDAFYPHMGEIEILGNLYTVNEYIDSSHITVVEPIADLTGVTFDIPKQAFLVYGDQFNESIEGAIINIDGTLNTVTHFIDPEHITFTGSTGTDVGLPYFLPTGVDGATVYVEATRGTFLDSYFIVNVPNSKTFAFSHQWDGKYFNALEQSVKEGYPDNIAAVYSDHEELWLFGTHWSTEVWRNEGVADVAGGFVRDPGAFVHVGCVAPWSIASVAGGLHFLGGDTRGRVSAYRMQGFQPVRVSTHALEQLWNTYTTVWDAYGYAYEEAGHQFWVISFQTADATFVYDVTAQQWHERATWDGSVWHKHKGRCHAYVFDRHFIGAWDSGIIYQQSQNLYTDAGTPIRRVRQAPHLSNEELNIIHHRLQIDLEVTGTAPSLSLDWSHDDGTTWNVARTRSPSISGNRGRVLFNRLGVARDRIYRVTTSDAVKVAIVDAYLNPQPTMGIS